MTSVWSSPERPAYPHQALAVVLQVRAARLHVMLWRRANEPFAGAWALPGGPLLADETLGASVARQLASKVEVHPSGPPRAAGDPQRSAAATPVGGRWPPPTSGSIPSRPGPGAARGHRLAPGRRACRRRRSTTARSSGRRWRRLRAKLSYTNVGFALAPPTFTIAELRDIYVAALGYDVTATNLQRVLLRRGVLEPTGEMAPPGRAGGRPATLYRFAAPALEVTDPFAVLRPPSARPA